MVLHLAHHKSYHPYKAENIERVRRDEELARLAEEQDEAQTLAVDAEARLEALRKKANAADKKRKRNAKEAGEVELDKQLQSKRNKGDDQQEEKKSRATIVRPEAPESQELNGHINFWADMEKGVVPTGTALPGNPEYLAEKAASQAKLEKQLGVEPMYLVCPPSSSKPTKHETNADLRPWYSSKDLRSTKERRKTQDQILEDTFKDNELKRTADPMAMMQGYLKKREEIHKAQEHLRNKPWDVTPLVLRKNEDVHVPLLRDRKKGRYVQAEVAAEEEEYGPMAPPPVPKAAISSSRNDLQSAAQARVVSERARAKALRAEAARQKEMASPASTPRSEYSAGYSGQFNKEATRDAHRRRDDRGGDRWKSQRWEDDSRDRSISSGPGSRRYYN